MTKLHYVAEKGIPDLQAGFVVSAEEHKIVQYLRSAGDYEQEWRIEFQYCTAYGRPRNLEEIPHHYEPRVGLNSLILWYEGIGEAVSCRHVHLACGLPQIEKDLAYGE